MTQENYCIKFYLVCKRLHEAEYENRFERDEQKSYIMFNINLQRRSYLRLRSEQCYSETFCVYY